MIFIHNVSMPRNGHHLLHRLLKQAYGHDFGYCSFYSKWKFDSFDVCCKSSPCKKALDSPFSLFLQKNHDWPIDNYVIDDSLRYLVQVRHPIPRLLSNYELHLRNSKQRKISPNPFEAVARAELDYYARFWNRWTGRSNVFVLRYKALCENPDTSLASALAFFEAQYDEADLRKAVAAEINARDISGVPYSPRKPQASEHYSSAWAERYMSELAEKCDRLFYQ